MWRAAAAFALAVLGRTDDARRAFEALAASGGGVAEIPRDGEWLATVALLVRTGARLGDARRTAALGALLEPFLDRAVTAGRGAICLGPVSRYAGLAAAAGGRRAQAIGHLDDALAVARRWGAEPTVAGIRLELAEVLAAPALGAPSADEARRAREERAGGLAIARRLELGGLLARYGEAGDAVPAAGAGADADAGAGASPADHEGAALRAAAATLAPAAFYRRGDIWTIGHPAARSSCATPRAWLTSRACSARRTSSSCPRPRRRARHHRGRATAAVAVGAGIEVRARGEGDAGPALDSQAKAAYRVRIAELQEEIDDASSFHDRERAARAREELAFVSRELAGAVGLHGRDRKTGSDAERARVNVTRAIRTALKRVAEHDAALGHRLGAAIRTGTFCVYEPAPGEEPAWDLTGPA